MHSNYYIKSKSDKEVSIWLYIKLDQFQKEIQIKSPYRIHSKMWRRGKVHSSHNNYIELTQWLADFKSSIERFCKANDLGNDRMITIQKIQDFIKPKVVESVGDIQILSGEFMQSQPDLSRSTRQGKERTFKLLKDYGYYHLSQFNDEFYKQYKTKFNSPNYFGKQIKHINEFLKWCVNKKEFKIKIPEYKVINEYSSDDIIALSSRELRKIYEIDFKDPDIQLMVNDLTYQLTGRKHDDRQIKHRIESVERARDYAIAMASCGTHVGDFWDLTDNNIVFSRGKEYIRYYRGKNRLKCISPYFDDKDFHFIEMRNKYGLPFPKTSRINVFMKYLNGITGINKPLTCKVMRKTCASIWYFERDMPISAVMKLLGHKKEETTRRYLGIDDEDHIMRFQPSF